MSYLELNPKQKEAVLHYKGSLLVVAGAGSGKTRVITARIAHLLLHHNVSPHSIVALTFTNKAAQEMKERLKGFLENHAMPFPFVGTFHSYCLYLLRKYSHFAPFKSFTILDEDDAQAIIKKIIKRHNAEKQISPSQARYAISQLKNSLKQKKEYLSFSSLFIQELHAAYEQEKREAHAFDFDDLLVEVSSLLTHNSEFKKLFHQSIKHILVDEYQDTNALQHYLLKQMAFNKDTFILDSICAVGDEDQAIYSWRGAVVTNMLTFKDDFHPVSTIKIEQNYRSVEPILKAANEVISNNVTRNEKMLWSTREALHRLISFRFRSEYQEAESVVACASYLLNQFPKQSCALLYRTHAQSRILEEACIHAGVPYKIIGSVEFYQRKEVKDLLAFLRLAINPFDRISFFRILNVPARGLGEKVEDACIAYWKKNPGHNFYTAVKEISEQHIFPPKKEETLKGLLTIWEGISSESLPSKALTQILEKTDYVSYLRQTHEKEEAEVKISLVKELHTAISFFEGNAEKSDSEKTLEQFLFNVALMQEKHEKEDESKPHVLMMTLHAAKGLEFDTVFLPGLEEEVFPSYNSVQNNASLEEERRLFYVGMTRARERIIFSYAQRRNQYGQTFYHDVSRFLTEVPSTLLKECNAHHFSPSTLTQFFKQWVHQTKEPASTISYFQEKAASLKKQSLFTPSFKTNQPVYHKKFGTGIIKKIEKKDEKDSYITVTFKCGEKKVLSSFIKLLG